MYQVRIATSTPHLHLLCDCSPGRLGAARTARFIVFYMYLYSTIRSGYLSACCSYEGSSIRAGRDGSRSLTLLWVPGISYKLHRVEKEAGTGNPNGLVPRDLEIPERTDVSGGVLWRRIPDD